MCDSSLGKLEYRVLHVLVRWMAGITFRLAQVKQLDYGVDYLF